MAVSEPQHEWSPKATPVNYWVVALIVCVWVANAGLITSAVFMFLNWGAVNWLVGDTECVKTTRYSLIPESSFIYIHFLFP